MNTIEIPEYRSTKITDGKVEYISVSEGISVKIVTRLLNCWAEIINVDPISLKGQRRTFGPFPKGFRARLAAWGVLLTEGQITPQYEERVGALWHKLINN